MATILSINGNFDQALQDLGHTVFSIKITQSGIFQARTYIEQCPAQPDIFLHKEHLAFNIFFSDIHSLPCATAHWGIDSHLRYWWQMYYAALFDVFFTPHKAFLEKLPTEWLHPHMHRLAEIAPKRPFIPHAKRTHDLNFVGRLSGTRPERKRICQLLLERYKVAHKENIPYLKMLDLYNETRIIPNESIAKEVNFRLLEGSACGCALITPHIGEDQDSLLEPDKEILIYRDIEELEKHINLCLEDTSFAEKLGRRAWIRVQKEHLASHRAQSFAQTVENFIAMAPSLAPKPSFLPMRRHEQHNTMTFRFAIGLMNIYNMLEIQDKDSFLNTLRNAPCLSLILNIFSTLKDLSKAHLTEQQAKERIFTFLHEANHCLLGDQCSASHKKMLAVAAGGAALRFQDAPRSQFYLLSYEKIQHPEKSISARQSLMGAEHMLDVALNWVFILRRDNKQFLAGTDYISGCCRTAFDFVSLCRELAPQDMRWFAALTSLDHVMLNFPEEEQLMVHEAATPDTLSPS